jgi:hypothetical protein
LVSQSVSNRTNCHSSFFSHVNFKAVEHRQCPQPG